MSQNSASSKSLCRQLSTGIDAKRLAQNRKRFLEQNGVNPTDASNLCLLPKDRLVRLLVEQRTNTDTTEFKNERTQIASNMTASAQGQKCSNITFFGKAQGDIPNLGHNYLIKEHKKSRWDRSPQKLPHQQHMERKSYGFDSAIPSTSSSYAEISDDLLSANISSGWNYTENAINDKEPIALMVEPIAVLLTDFPRSKLTRLEMDTIEEAIVDKVLLVEDIKPQFYGTTYEDGYLAMLCCNNVTSEWIKKIIPSIKPWPSAHMCAIEESKVPYPKVIVGKFLTSADLPTEVILDNIKHQNPNLNVDDWRLIARKNNNTSSMLALSIDRISAARLEENKNRVSFRLLQVILHSEDVDVF